MATRFCGNCYARAADEPCDGCIQDLGYPKWKGESLELSRLRDLVREMREALGDAVNNGRITNSEHDGRAYVYCTACGANDLAGDSLTHAAHCEWETAIALIAKSDAILKESGKPVKYGCHVDFEHGGTPDGCVIDEGQRQACLYSRRNGGAGVQKKEDCQYWRPIK